MDSGFRVGTSPSYLTVPAIVAVPVGPPPPAGAAGTAGASLGAAGAGVASVLSDFPPPPPHPGRAIRARVATSKRGRAIGFLLSPPDDRPIWFCIDPPGPP